MDVPVMKLRSAENARPPALFMAAFVPYVHVCVSVSYEFIEKNKFIYQLGKQQRFQLPQAKGQTGKGWPWLFATG